MSRNLLILSLVSLSAIASANESNSVFELITGNEQCTIFAAYIQKIGDSVLPYLTSLKGRVTVFAPTNEAFRRIPDDVQERLLQHRDSVARILKLHIVPGLKLTSSKISNRTVTSETLTADQTWRLAFSKGESAENNDTWSYYVTGGGVRAAIEMDDDEATNGVVQYIDHVLGVPDKTIFRVISHESNTKRTYEDFDHLTLRCMLDPWKVEQPEQNFTFFVPTNEAWQKQSPTMMFQFRDGKHWRQLQNVYMRHLIRGQVLTSSDLRERTYVMLNNDKVIVRRRGRYFELYWPYGNKVARLVEGGEMMATNGVIHLIDDVLILPEDVQPETTVQPNTTIQDNTTESNIFRFLF